MIQWLSGFSEKEDYAVNMFVIVLMISGIIISTLLNPIILLYYWRNDTGKLSRRLFMMLALSDLLTNSYPLIHVLYFCISPHYKFSVNVDKGRYVDPMFRHYAVPSLIMCTFGCISQVTTSVLGIVRMISIFRPFFHYDQWIPLAYITIFSIVMALNNFAFAYCHFLAPTDSVGRMIAMAVDACYWMTVIMVVLGIVASVVTFLKLFSKRKVEKSRMRSCWIIMLMNIPYVLSIINFILSKTNLAKFGYVYLAFVVIPCFTSLYNPLVIVFMTDEIRRFTRKMLRDVKRGCRRKLDKLRGVKAKILTQKISTSTTRTTSTNRTTSVLNRETSNF